jgi:hypothetical protein
MAEMGKLGHHFSSALTNFANADRGTEVSERLKQSMAYREYLQSVKERLPLAAFEFGTASWHYDHRDHRCPHDSWVDSLTIHEPATGGRLSTMRRRRTQICDCRTYNGLADRRLLYYLYIITMLELF